MAQSENNDCLCIPFDGGELRVAFELGGDCYEHEVALIANDKRVQLLSSQVPTENRDWPASPPAQQLTIDSQPDGNVSLLVGQAGRSHWSASVSADQKTGSLTFDVACRVKGSPTFLGSAYQLGEEAVWSESSHCVAATVDSVLIVVQAESPETACTINDGLLRITPTWQPQPKPHTVCWKYTIELAVR